jgi:hypothetical protein
VHLRRALLLFAIVLGLAAVAASLSRSDRGRSGTVPAGPSAPEDSGARTDTTPAPDPGSARVQFVEGGPREVRTVRVGRAVTAIVVVKRPGQVELRGLDLTRNAEPGAPASFDVFQAQPGSFPVLLHPAAGGRAETLGTLRVTR